MNTPVKDSLSRTVEDGTASFMTLKEQIRSRLAGLRFRILDSGFNREAAVLMPIFEQDGEPHFLLTRRTNEVQTHKGQISFPGGMRESEEDLETTALRETLEEVGIESDRIELLGRFHDFQATTGYRVSPFAGYIDGPFTTTPQTHEVAEILRVPFRIFLDPSRLRIEQMPHLGRMRDVYFYSYGVYEIWGLTARIIKEFLEELQRHPDQP
ncbi:MAG TPA: CoA pyrophosphatase [Acidobacteriota bacterium]|nr:CoA pyrophosphatase [Acidobacteriota bacterium]